VPFLRVIRDKRGYETTYLMHWFHESGRQRSRILYAFRTPSGTRVGRDALDPALMRQIEALHPDIAFDWKAVQSDRQVIEPSTEIRRRKPKRSDEAKPAAEAPPAVVEQVVAVVAPTPRPAIPAVLEGATTDERVAFLVHWYPLVRERVERRATDPERQAALLSLAERMNPAEWPSEEIEMRMPQAAEALERLAHVFARRRRRTRRRPGDSSPPLPPAATPAASS